MNVLKALKAKTYNLHFILQKGQYPNYSSCRILMEGYH